MPWDGCELWVAALETPGTRAWWPAAPASRSGSPSGARPASCISCRTATAGGTSTREDAQLTDERAELGYPQWLFGGSTYAFLADGSHRVHSRRGAVERLCVLRPGADALEDLGLALTAFGFPYAAAPRRPVDLRRRQRRDRRGAWSGLERGEGVRGWSSARPSDPLAPAWASLPRAIEFPSGAGAQPTRSTTRRRTRTSRRPQGERAAADRAEPRRAHRPRAADVRPGDPVLDEPRDRRGGRELRRQHRLRPRLPRAAERRLGGRGRGGLRGRRAAPGAGGRGRRRAPGRSTAAAPAATRPSAG